MTPKTLIFATLSMTTLVTACKARPDAVHLHEARPLTAEEEVAAEQPETQVEPTFVEVAVPVPTPVMRDEPEETDTKPVSPAQMAKVVDKANEAAREAPREEAFLDAVQVYPYTEHMLYQVVAAPNKLTMITFGEGEAVTSFAAGDTVRWVVEKTSSGVGEAAREHLLIQPVRAKMTNSLVVTTTRGVYLFELHARTKSYHARVSFTYPESKVELVKQAHAAEKERAVEAKRSGALELARPIDELVSDYQVIVKRKSRRAKFIPRAVFHDGKRTYIEFAHNMEEHTQAPALFLLGPEQQQELVQYRVQGKYYIVPRVIEHARLRARNGLTVGIELIAD